MDDTILGFVCAPEGVAHGGSKGRNAGFRGICAELTVVLLRTDRISGSLVTSGGVISPGHCSKHDRYMRH